MSDKKRKVKFMWVANTENLAGRSTVYFHEFQPNWVPDFTYWRSEEGALFSIPYEIFKKTFGVTIRKNSCVRIKIDASVLIVIKRTN